MASDLDFNAMSLKVRKGCWCADQRTPCSYHEGWWDGLEAALPILQEVGAERDRLAATVAAAQKVIESAFEFRRRWRSGVGWTDQLWDFIAALDAYRITEGET